MTQLLGTAQGDGVDNAAVEHRYAVYHDYLAHVGQAARSLDDVQGALAVVGLAEIHSPAGKAVGSNHLEMVGILEVGIKVEGDKLIGELVIE